MLLATSTVPLLNVFGLMQELCSSQLCLHVNDPMELPFASHALGMCQPPLPLSMDPVRTACS
jgi:hypothetical protein